MIDGNRYTHTFIEKTTFFRVTNDDEYGSAYCSMWKLHILEHTLRYVLQVYNLEYLSLELDIYQLH